MIDFVVIRGDTFTLETGSDMIIAGIALGQAGLQSAEVYRSPTNDIAHPDTVKTGICLYAISPTLEQE